MLVGAGEAGRYWLGSAIVDEDTRLWSLAFMSLISLEIRQFRRPVVSNELTNLLAEKRV